MQENIYPCSEVYKVAYIDFHKGGAILIENFVERGEGGHGRGVGVKVTQATTFVIMMRISHESVM